MMDLLAGFRKAFDMVGYFSNYVLLAKNYLTIYQLKFYLQGLVSTIQMVKFLELNAQPTTTRFIPQALPRKEKANVNHAQNPLTVISSSPHLPPIHLFEFFSFVHVSYLS